MPIHDGNEVNNSIWRINASLTNKISEAKQNCSAIQEFVYNEELTGTAYQSQKNYFGSAYLSLYRAIEQFGLEYKRANTNLQSMFSKVDNDSSAYIDTDALENELTGIVSSKRYYIDNFSDFPLINNQIYFLERLENTLNIKLNLMNNFISISSDNYKSVKDYLRLIQQGVSAVSKDCWDSTTQTYQFDLSRNNWIDSINARYYEDNLIANGMSKKEYNHLTEIGYSPEEIHDMYNSFESDEDKEMFLMLANQDYEKAFATDPDTLSANMNAFIGDYATRVAILDMKNADESNDYKVPNIQKLMNALTLSDCEYESSNQFKHLLTISAILSMDIDSDAMNVYLNGDYTIDASFEAKYKANFYGLCQAAVYLNTVYDEKPGRLPSIQSDPNSIIQSSTIYTLFGFNFDELTYNGAFNFEASYQSGYIHDNDMNIDINMGRDIKSINSSKVIVSNTSSFMKELDYYTTLNAIEKRKAELLEDFFLKGTALLVGVWNPILGSTIATATNLTRDESGKEITKYVLKGNKYVLSEEYKSMDGRTTDGKKYKGTYGKSILASFDFMTNGVDLIFAYNSLDKEKKAAVEVYLNFIYGKSAGEIKITDDKNDAIFKGDFLDYNQMYVLGQWNEHGLKNLECTNEKLKKALSEIEFDGKGVSKDVSIVVNELLEGGYDFSKIGGEGKYDIEVFIDAISEINQLISADSSVNYDVFEDIIQPLTIK